MNVKAVAFSGARKSLGVLWELAVVMIPIVIAVQALEHYGVMQVISRFFSPMMSLFGVPGEAATALAMGYLVGPYLAFGVVIGLGMTVKQITIIAVMLALAHSLPVETAILGKSGADARAVLAARLISSIIAGILLNLIL